MPKDNGNNMRRGDWRKAINQEEVALKVDQVLFMKPYQQQYRKPQCVQKRIYVEKKDPCGKTKAPNSIMKLPANC